MEDREKPHFCVFFKVTFISEGWKRTPVCRNRGEKGESPSIPHCTEGLMQDWHQWQDRNCYNPIGLDYALFVDQDRRQRIARVFCRGSAVVTVAWRPDHTKTPECTESPAGIQPVPTCCVAKHVAVASVCHGIADSLEFLSQATHGDVLIILRWLYLCALHYVFIIWLCWLYNKLPSSLSNDPSARGFNSALFQCKSPV